MKRLGDPSTMDLIMERLTALEIKQDADRMMGQYLYMMMREIDRNSFDFITGHILRLVEKLESDEPPAIELLDNAEEVEDYKIQCKQRAAELRSYMEFFDDPDPPPFLKVISGGKT